jgi:hypothetical protein
MRGVSGCLKDSCLPAEATSDVAPLLADHVGQNRQTGTSRGTGLHYREGADMVQISNIRWIASKDSTYDHTQWKIRDPVQFLLCA